MTGDDLEPLLEKLGRQRFIFHQFRTDQHGRRSSRPGHDWGEVADVLILADEHHACAYRTPLDRDADVFDPNAVYWFN